jgi:low affinity Fe/Cu permease
MVVMPGARPHSWFTHFAKVTSRAAGRPTVFVGAVLIVLAWAFTGPLFGFSDTWQLVINTSTTIITFLMVFLIQNTQNRDTEALQVKLDELIHAMRSADDSLLDLEELEEDELDAIRDTYQQKAAGAQSGAYQRAERARVVAALTARLRSA